MLGTQWGNLPSKNADYTVLLKTLLRSSGVKVKEENFQKLFQAIHKHCHWLDPEKGTWCLSGWKEVMPCLSRAYQSGEPIPKTVWFLSAILFILLWLLYTLNDLTFRFRI